VTAFITDGNLVQLTRRVRHEPWAGPTRARARHYLDRERFTSISKAVSDVIAYANSTSGSDSNSGKYFFANGHDERQKSRSPTKRWAIFKTIDGAPRFPSVSAMAGRRGAPGADKYGNSRPFQTEPTTLPIVGPDYFNVPAGNEVYNRGPIMNLIDKPILPERTHDLWLYGLAPARRTSCPIAFRRWSCAAAEYGNDRIILGRAITRWTCWGRANRRDPTILRICSPTIPLT